MSFWPNLEDGRQIRLRPTPARQGAEIRMQRTAYRRRRTVSRRQSEKAKIRTARTLMRGQRTEGREQKAVSRSRRLEVRRKIMRRQREQRPLISILKSVIANQPSVVRSRD